MSLFHRTENDDWKCNGCGAGFDGFLKENNLPEPCPYCPSEEKNMRLTMESSAYEYLNRTKRHGGFYDCGELGVLAIKWARNGWSPEWITVTPAPWLTGKEQ